MTLLAPWLLFPAVFGVVCLGAGLLLERVSGVALTGALRMPAGLALVIVLAQFTTMGSAAARLTTPLVVGVAVAGFALSAGRRFRRPHLAPAAAAVGTFAVYAAPVVLSGKATFTGYVKLDDTATFLGFTDQLMTHGRDLAGLAPSTYEVMLLLNLGGGYPAGTFLPLGIGAQLTGQDPAWLFQPCMAFFAATAALGLYSVLGGLVRSSALRAFAAFVAAQAALLYAYSLWGGIKEVAAAAMFALAAALAPARINELQSGRALVPFAVAAAATLGVLSVFGVLWMGPLALPALVMLVRRERRPLRPVVFGVAATAVFAIPSLAIARHFINAYSGVSLVEASQSLGNLVRPLKVAQIFGIWPAGDFRFTPSDYTITKILIAFCALLAVCTAVYAVRRGAIRLPLIALVCVGAALVLQRESSPWIVAKALAEGSPFVVLIALAGAAVVFEAGWRVEGAIAAALVTSGVLWSNALGYHAAWLAPRSQLAELQRIGERFAGDGPALMTEYQPYGVRHFLRRLEAEGASELRAREDPLADGTVLDKGGYADMDQFRYPDVLVYRTLVLRTSPVESRPSAPYELVSRGRFYDVWVRPRSGAPQVLEHLPLGSADDPLAIPPCSEVRSAAERAAREGAVLAAATGSDPLIVPLGSGALQASVILAKRARYRVWLNGSFFRKVAVDVDGKRVGSVDTSGSLYTPFGAVSLAAGRHAVTVHYGGSLLAPASGAPVYPLGPLVFSLAGPPAAVEYVQPTDAASFCGRKLDWLEIVRR
jgi:hypothetical protein